ncbi:MAG: AMP-binding protein [Oscillospiraceae bacterium]|jgi:acetyl-CoA synthetase|nr:AMP-binding protein [Oscillospiraceae bacterium]
MAVDEEFLARFCNTKYDSYEDFYANFKVTYPADFNYGYDVTDALAALHPAKTALVWCNDLGEERILTFAEIKRQSDKYCNALRAMGVGTGDVVMVMLKRRYEFWFFCIAAHKLGAVLIPATHMLKAKDIVYRVEAAHVKMVLAVNEDAICTEITAANRKMGGAFLQAALGQRDGFADFAALAAQSSDAWERVQLDSKKPMLAYFTSGTTGMPKIVTHDFYYPLGHITTAKFWHGLGADDLHLTVADTGWAKTAWGKIYGQWMCESALFVYDYDSRFHPTDFLRLIDQYKITSFCAPPTIYRFLIKEDLRQYSLKSLRSCTIAGEPLNPEVYEQWLAATGHKLREGFGQTEGPVMVATTVWTQPRPGSMGKSIAGIACDVYDAQGRLCEPGEEGEMCIPYADGQRPLGLFMTYLGEPERYDSVVYGGLYHTGDSAWRDEDGYIWFKGRNDDIIKSSGYRIGPFEVESALLEHPAVKESAITGVPDPVRGLSVKATVVLAAGWEASDALAKELQEHVKRTTAPYKYPRIIEFVEELPKTISGKIRRVEIRQNDERQNDAENA